MLRSFWRDERGTTAIEYVFVAGLIALVIIGTVRQLGVKLNANYYSKVSGNLS